MILKEKIAELACFLEEANQFFCEWKEKHAAEELFATCQDAAIQIGNVIEKNDAKSGKTVSYLEEYCELIYKLYTSEISDWEDILHQLEQTVLQIKESIEHISEEKMKVVFLPYSASMWDTFDSIYTAAKEDSRFDVKVIPIPYYNLDPDGRPCKMNYEGEEIKQYAPITDFRRYNFALERPDVVLIHNPYDEHNRVTRILEPFYSSNLTQYTSHLVYIPYYVSKGQTMGHLLEMPGVTNAWKIFVQNEMVRKQYISAGIAEEKVVALGSPKFDMAISSSKKERQLPEEWSVLKGKKIFFYNTAITDILNNGTFMLQKIQHVMDVFTHFNGMALLWRPHPLSLSTMQSMMPELVDGYLEAVRNFKDSSLGIYDESGDLERAIAVSDGYIGDVDSSVSQLYEVTGKPAFYVDYHDTDFIFPQRWGRCFCGEVIEQKIYMYSWEYNKFFIYDEDKKTVEIQKGNEQLGEYEKYLYLRSVKDGNTVYFTSGLAPQILKYDTVTHNKEWIDIGDGDNRSDCILYQEKLYLLPVYYSDIIKVLDLETGIVSCTETHYQRQFPELEKTMSAPMFDGGILVGNTVWRICYLGPILQKFDLKSQQFHYMNVNGLEEPLCSLAFDGRYFWLAALYGGRVYKWDPKSNQILQVISVDTQETSNQEQKEKFIVAVYYFQKRVWIFLKKKYQLIRIETLTGKVRVIDYAHLFQEVPFTKSQSLFSGNIRGAGEMLYVFPKGADGIVKVDTRSEQVTLERIPAIGVLEQIAGNTVNESMCSLEDFLHWTEHGRERPDLEHPSAGEKIWAHITKHMYQ